MSQANYTDLLMEILRQLKIANQLKYLDLVATSTIDVHLIDRAIVVKP